MSLPHKEEASRNSLTLCWDVSPAKNNLLFKRGTVIIEIGVYFSSDVDSSDCLHGYEVRQPKITLRNFQGPRSFAELTCAQYFLFIGGNCTDIGATTLTSGSITGIASPKLAGSCVCLSEYLRNRVSKKIHFRLVLEVPGGLFPIHDIASCDRARWSKFAQLFNNPDLSDVTIVTASGEEIKVRSAFKLRVFCEKRCNFYRNHGTYW